MRSIETRGDRLDPYRNHIAELTREGVLAGYVLILTQQWDTLDERAFIWWRRWSRDPERPQPVVRLTDGRYWNRPLEQSEMDEHLKLWSENTFRLDDELFRMRWLNSVETLSMASAIFGAVPLSGPKSKIAGWRLPPAPTDG